MEDFVKELLTDEGFFKKVLLYGIITGVFLISIITYGIASAQENNILLIRARESISEI